MTRVLKALGLLVGMIIGAGMFAMPYAVAQAGAIWSLVHFLFAAVAVTAIHILYGHVLIASPLKHRLPGYVGHYLGRAWYEVAFLSRLFSYFGYLLAYGVLAGLFFQHFFPNVPLPLLSVLFFLGVAPFLWLTLRNAGSVNLPLAFLLVLCVLALFYLLAPHFRPVSLSAWGGDGAWFLPYGIFLFAFSGASVIPEIIGMLGKERVGEFRGVVIAGTLIVAFVYILFIGAILAVYDSVPQDGISQLEAIAGRGAFAISSLIGLLAIVTSHFALGLELRYTLQYDAHLPRFGAWLAIVIVPLALYLVGANSFITILSVIGAVGIGIEGLLIVLLARRVLRTHAAVVAGFTAIFALGALFGIADALGLLSRVF